MPERATSLSRPEVLLVEQIQQGKGNVLLALEAALDGGKDFGPGIGVNQRRRKGC